MDYQSIFYPEKKFGGFTGVDGTIAFYIRVNSLVNSSSVVLDVGCGEGVYANDPVLVRRNLRIFKGRCEKVIGIDVDEKAGENPFLDEFFLLENSRWPIEDESVDVCICDNLLEHIEDPQLFFSECRRVIKKDGFLCVRTPNVLSYFGLISRLMPNKLHAWLLKKVQSGRKEENIFPTFYRCNTKRKVKRILDKYGFDNCVYGYEAEPSYLSFSRFFYFLGVLHQKYAPNMFKIAIFAFGKKREAA